MHTRKILSIVALSLLGLCLLCALAKNAMKGDKSKKACDSACSMSVFAALALLAVSQLMGEKEKYTSDLDCQCYDSSAQPTGNKCNKPQREGGDEQCNGWYCRQKGDFDTPCGGD